VTTIPVYVEPSNRFDKARLIGEASDDIEMEDVAKLVGVKSAWLYDGWISGHQGERRWLLFVDDQYFPHVEPSPDYLAKVAFARLPPFEQALVEKAMQAPPKISLAETMRILGFGARAAAALTDAP
jgi:hypothetical protein